MPALKRSNVFPEVSFRLRAPFPWHTEVGALHPGQQRLLQSADGRNFRLQLSNRLRAGDQIRVRDNDWAGLGS